MDLDEFDENVRNNPNELNALILDKIAALKERLQSRVGALKHNVRQVASAEKDVKEIIVLLGSACSKYQFLHSRENGVTVPGKDPVELVNDPIVTDAANAISRAHGFYMADSATGTGNGSGQRSGNERKASNKSPGPSRRSHIQMLAGASPTNAESNFKHETPIGRTAPLSARTLSAIGKQGRSSASAAAFTATGSSGAMSSKQSLPTSHDSAVEHVGVAFGRLAARPSVPLIENEGKECDLGHGTLSQAEAEAQFNSARGSGSSVRNGNGNGNINGNGNGSANDQNLIELEQLTVQR
jgi:hypothetical protein